MRNKLEKLVHNVGTIHGYGISNELLNKNTIIITKPDHTQYELYEHQLAIKTITGRTNAYLNMPCFI